MTDSTPRPRVREMDRSREEVTGDWREIIITDPDRPSREEGNYFAVQVCWESMPPNKVDLWVMADTFGEAALLACDYVEQRPDVVEDQLWRVEVWAIP